MGGLPFCGVSRERIRYKGRREDGLKDFDKRVMRRRTELEKDEEEEEGGEVLEEFYVSYEKREREEYKLKIME